MHKAHQPFSVAGQHRHQQKRRHPNTEDFLKNKKKTQHPHSCKVRKKTHKNNQAKKNQTKTNLQKDPKSVRKKALKLVTNCCGVQTQGLPPTFRVPVSVCRHLAHAPLGPIHQVPWVRDHRARQRQSRRQDRHHPQQVLLPNLDRDKGVLVAEGQENQHRDDAPTQK
jgi:hypothetical protein